MLVVLLADLHCVVNMNINHVVLYYLKQL